MQRMKSCGDGLQNVDRISSVGAYCHWTKHRSERSPTDRWVEIWHRWTTGSIDWKGNPASSEVKVGWDVNCSGRVLYKRTRPRQPEWLGRWSDSGCSSLPISSIAASWTYSMLKTGPEICCFERNIPFRDASPKRIIHEDCWLVFITASINR